MSRAVATAPRALSLREERVRAANIAAVHATAAALYLLAGATQPKPVRRICDTRPGSAFQGIVSAGLAGYRARNPG